MDPYGAPVMRISKDDGAIYTMGPWARSGERFAFASNTRDKKDFDIYEYTLEDSTARMLFRGDGMNAAAAYSPDARSVLVLHEYSSTNTDLYLFDANSQKARLLTEHTGDVRFADPVWDADGKGFYLITDRGREFTGVAYWPKDSSNFRWVETPDWDVEDIALSEDGTMLGWSVNENGISRFHFRDFRRGWDASPGRLPAGVIRDLVFSHDGSLLAFTFGSAARPYDVWVYDTNADKMHQVTYSATGGIPATVFHEPELIEYPSFDGRDIPAYWYTPDHVSGKMPVVIAIHGGPEAQARPDLSGLYQYFLQHGYAVLEPNVRGSSGYGRSYLAMDNVRNRMDAVKDLEAAARWLTAKKDVDAKKLATFGGSYGGFMVVSALTTYPDLWAAGVCIDGITNFVTFLQNTGVYRRATREAEYGNLETDREFLSSISPANHVDQIKAPLFLIQGANDPRVPREEAEQMADSIRQHGGSVQYMVFDDEGHGLSKLKNRITAYTAVCAFLDAHLTGK
jgi:dipeptidyl aminopeptidase/acylaminoacyl peptidase